MAAERAPQRRFSSSRTNCMEKPPINHNCLRQHPFFKERDPKLLDLLMENLFIKVFFPGANIITEGEEGDCLYFLHRGEVEVLVGHEEKQVAKLGDGSLFGEMALLGRGRRAATVRALIVCDCRSIDLTAFRACLQRFPTEKNYFCKLAAERMAALNSAGGVSPHVSCKTEARPINKLKKGVGTVRSLLKLKTRFGSCPPMSESVAPEEDLVSPRVSSAPKPGVVEAKSERSFLKLKAKFGSCPPSSEVDPSKQGLLDEDLASTCSSLSPKTGFIECESERRFSDRGSVAQDEDLAFPCNLRAPKQGCIEGASERSFLKFKAKFNSCPPSSEMGSPTQVSDADSHFEAVICGIQAQTQEDDLASPRDSVAPKPCFIERTSESPSTKASQDPLLAPLPPTSKQQGSLEWHRRKLVPSMSANACQQASNLCCGSEKASDDTDSLSDGKDRCTFTSQSTACPDDMRLSFISDRVSWASVPESQVAASKSMDLQEFEEFAPAAHSDTASSAETRILKRKYKSASCQVMLAQGSVEKPSFDDAVHREVGSGRGGSSANRRSLSFDAVKSGSQSLATTPEDQLLNPRRNSARLRFQKQQEMVCLLPPLRTQKRAVETWWRLHLRHGQ